MSIKQISPRPEPSTLYGSVRLAIEAASVHGPVYKSGKKVVWLAGKDEVYILGGPEGERHWVRAERG